jgi:hypothetical protein
MSKQRTYAQICLSKGLTGDHGSAAFWLRLGVWGPSELSGYFQCSELGRMNWQVSVKPRFRIPDLKFVKRAGAERGVLISGLTILDTLSRPVKAVHSR